MSLKRAAVSNENGWRGTGSYVPNTWVALPPAFPHHDSHLESRLFVLCAISLVDGY